MSKDRQIVSELRNFFYRKWLWARHTEGRLHILKMGKYQCRDFGSQIASISLNMLQYNLLSYVKRFESYETIGGLFREITAQTLELSVTEKIWGSYSKSSQLSLTFSPLTSMNS